MEEGRMTRKTKMKNGFQKEHKGGRIVHIPTMHNEQCNAVDLLVIYLSFV